MSVAHTNALTDDRVDSELWNRRISRFLPWTGLPWMLVAYVSIMAGGAPNVSIGPVILCLLWILWTYPVTAFVGLTTSRLFQRRGNPRYAFYSLIVPGSLGALIVALFLAPFVIGLFQLCTGELWSAGQFQDVSAEL